jgi:hypothetical protein
MKSIMVFLFAVGVSGCGSSSLEISRSEVCEAQVDETSCRESDCAWRISRKLWLEDGVCAPITDFQYFCTARGDNPDMVDEERTTGYYRDEGDGYQILFVLNHNGTSIPGWSRCDEKPGWYNVCWTCGKYKN